MKIDIPEPEELILTVTLNEAKILLYGLHKIDTDPFRKQLVEYSTYMGTFRFNKSDVDVVKTGLTSALSDFTEE